MKSRFWIKAIAFSITLEPLLADPKLHEVVTSPLKSQGLTLPGYESRHHAQNPLSLLKPASVSDALSSLKGRLHHKVEMVVSQSNPGLNLQSMGTSSQTVHYQIAGTSLCEYETRVSQDLASAITFYYGAAPRLLDQELPTTWPKLDSTQEYIIDHLGGHGIEGVSFVDFSPCYLIRQEQLHAVWNYKVMDQNGLTYKVVAMPGEIFRFEPQFFHADGKATTYAKNNLDSELQEFSLSGLDAGGRLSNSYFSTSVWPSSGYEDAIAEDFNFTFDPLSSAFAQTSLFVNAMQSLGWFQSLGYNSFGDSKIKIYAHVAFESGGQVNLNNAQYQPSYNGAPTIMVADGDGIYLQHLATDADVVAHEFGHHVVFNTLTTTTGQSLVLHEGLADYFTFARTGDSCLGESICPSQSGVCAVTATCLRSADNSYTYGSSDLPTLPHLRSQFISGMLWDLTAKDGININDMARITLNGVSYLAASSGYRDLIISLLQADLSLHQGSHCNQIYNRAVSRGLGSFISDISCNKLAGLPTIESEAGSGTQSSSSESSDSSGLSGICGTIARGDQMASWLWFMILLFPVLMGSCYRGENSTVPIRLKQLAKRRYH